MPAAGTGTRLGAGLPKAMVLVAGEPLLLHCVRRLRGCPSVGPVVVAAPVAAVEDVRALLQELDVTVVAGGLERQESVAAGLRAMPEVELVLVHDAARAFMPAAVVEAVIQALREGAEAVVPVVAVADTIKRIDGSRVTTVPREDLRAAQTPQGFRRAVLEAAHAQGNQPLSDDAALVEALGVSVRTVPGSAEGFKVTTPFDLMVAAALVSRG